MANREKKVSLGRRQAPASPIPPKEGTTQADSPAKLNAKSDVASADDAKPTASVKAPAVKNVSAIAKKLSKTAAKKAIKKNLTIQLKAKTKKPAKINQKLTKNVMNNQKTNLESKKAALLKNGVVKVKQIRKPKVQAAPKNQEEAPPVLEPIFPVEDNAADKKQPRKRVNKKVASPSDDSKKPKTDIAALPEDATTNTIATPDLKLAKKLKQPKKTKAESNTQEPGSETIEEVMNDLSSLIAKDPIEPLPELPPKPKKYTKKQIDILRRKLIKKENIENTLSKLDPSQTSVIDMLDLNVQKLTTKPIRKRRHSIEKFPIGTIDNADAPTIAQLTIFNNIPRSISPRAKRASKIRQSVDTLAKRSSPYSTRSDSPARILRNGKHRKLRDLNLFEGLDMQFKKRKRLCSDFSGSEQSVSKLSGYESDSSFSDLASLHGADNPETKEAEVKVEADTAESSVNNISESQATIAKRTPSTEEMEVKTSTDSNSNLYNDKLPETSTDNQNDTVPTKEEILPDPVAVNPSIKVPDKSIILDIMKQTFNDVVMEEQDKEKRTTRSSARKTGKTNDGDSVSTSKFCCTSSDVVETLAKEEAHLELEEKPAPENGKTDDAEPKVTENEEEKQPESEVECKPEEVPQDKSDEVVPVVEAEEKKDVEVPAVDILITEDPPKVEEVLQDTVAICEPETPAIALEEPLIAPDESNVVYEEPMVENDDLKENIVEETIPIPETFPIPEPIPTPEPSQPQIIETPENLAIKENILQALGLQSLKAAEEAKLKEKVTPKSDSYTGTLKTVIKLNRYDKKKGRNSLKMTLQKNKSKGSDSDLAGGDDDMGYKIMKEGTSSSWKSHNKDSSDTAGAHRKSHYSNRSNMDGSSEHTSDGDTVDGQVEGAGKALVIPEKASSFSIHPGRLCKDECSYCFGKFGLFDTPCHIAQMKSVERQDKILAAEKHLTRDSCLCDACYRHVDRKSNTPSYSNKSSYKRSSLVAPGPRQNHCHVLGCSRVSTNILRRKWIIKMRKSVCKVINIDLDNPGLHSIPICDDHYAALEHLMVCALCKRRLARNHIHYLGPESRDLNSALNVEGIPIKLMDKPVVCKLCRYFATLVLKDVDERPENTYNFFKEYKKRLLHFNNLEHMNEAEAEEPIPVPTKDRSDKDQPKKKKKTKSQSDSEQPPVLEPQIDIDKSRVPSDSNGQSRPDSPSDYMIDYHTLIPSIAMECGSDVDAPKHETTKQKMFLKKINRPDTVKEAVEISKKLKNKSDIAVQRLGSNPSISVRQLFPGEEDLPLQAHVDFNNIKERTPEGWEKCTTTIQYDVETKNLWQELQKPYGNQSSFLRHLILLEKYFRSGDLVLSQTASHHSISYSESVQNRLRAYDNLPLMQPSALKPAITLSKPQRSTSGIITSKDVPPAFTILNAANIPKNTPITISQINNQSFLTNSAKTKTVGVPPGLISLNRAPAPPLVKLPQSQKIKFPIPNNWRPNLIPIDPSKKTERKAGLVQVISGGKPYHITMEDYKKMCAIKRTFELKNKRLQTATNGGNSVLKGIAPKKGLVITKTSTVTKPDIEPTESSLEKLDKAVEKLQSKILSGDVRSSMNLPKIPKSLTVIPQTVTRKPSRPSSPVLLITPKTKVKS